MSGLFAKKDLARLIADANDPNAAEGGHAGTLKRTLGAFNLTTLGIGAKIVGSSASRSAKRAENPDDRTWVSRSASLMR